MKGPPSDDPWFHLYMDGQRLFFTGSPPSVSAFYWEEERGCFVSIKGRDQFDLLTMARQEECRMCRKRCG